MLKPSTKNQARGTVHEMKGKLKEAVGKITKDEDLEAEGIVEGAVGKVQKKVGEIGKVLGN